jgi:hypothetical protein
MEGKKPVKCASGSLDMLRPVRCGFGKKVLIVGRGLLLHVRKKYPPAPEKELFKAVALEIGDMFPFSVPAFHCRVFQSADTHALVDVWAWESGLYPQIRKIFPFGYVVPEDLAFSSVVPEMKLCRYGGTTSMLAYAEGKFLAGASFPESAFCPEDVERFLHSLEQYAAPIKNVRIYGDLQLKLNDTMQISRTGAMDHPPCLDEIASLEISGFRAEGALRLGEKKGLLFRIAVYLVLGYALMQYLTLKNYDHAAEEIRQKLSVLDNKAVILDTNKQTDDYSAVFQEIKEKQRAAPSPLKVMALLARKLPEGTFITKMTLNENNVELMVSSSDPLSTLKALSGAAEVKKLSLKRSIVKDRTSKLSNFGVVIELAN